MNNELNMSNSPLKVIPLSGAETIGLNSYIVEYKNDIFVIDYGVTFPSGESFGVDYLLPPIEYLKANKDRIKAIIVTHAHLDHIGGIPFVIDLLGYPPVYGSPFAVEFLKDKLAEVKKDKQTKLNVVGKDDVLKFGEVSVSFVHVTHSIPQSYAVCFHTPEGRVFYTGDYKFDETPINQQPTEVDKIAELGKKGVLVALLDSTNAFEPGKSKSEKEIVDTLVSMIKIAKGRVIIAAFSSMVSRLAGVIEAAKTLNKRILIIGRSLENNVKIAMRIGYIHPQAGIIISKKDVEKIPDNQLIILTTGSQGESNAALTRIANNRHSFLTIKKTDTVIMSSSIVPGNALIVQKLIDAISRRGARIINSRLMNVHATSHPNQDDMIRMAKLINAKYNIPVHGFPASNLQHKFVLTDAGFAESSIFVPVEGGVFSFRNGVMTQDKKIEVEQLQAIEQVLISSKEPLVLDRKAMASDGICAVSVIQSKGGTLQFSVTLRGFDFADRVKEIVLAIKARLSSSIKSIADEKETKRKIYSVLGIYFHTRFQRYPVLSVDVVKE